MADVKFWLGDNDVDRLFAVKEDRGLDNLSANDFARLLLEETLHRLHPGMVKFDDDGNRIKEGK